MKRLILILLFIGSIFQMLFSAEINQNYRKQILTILEEQGLSTNWDENEKMELIKALHQNRISIQAIRFVARNLPDNTNLETAGGVQSFLVKVCKEIDPLIKKGIEPARMKCFFTEYINTMQADTQGKTRMLKSFLKKENEKIELQYRNRQILRYQYNKETTQGGGGNQYGSGNAGGYQHDNVNSGGNQHGINGKEEKIINPADNAADQGGS